MSRQDVITIPSKERNRETGIPAVGAVPWGMHLCCFYGAKQDLLDVLVPYFKAGLENNEFCIWVTSETLGVKEAKQAMTKAVPDFAQYLERGQIEIIPYTEWYLKDGAFNRQRVLNAWIDKLDRATANGYDGMRVTGDMAWLGKRHWRKFTDYEEEVNNVIGKYHMLVICTYSLGRCGASETIDVVNRHQYALIRQAGNWVLTRSSERKRAEEALQASEEQHRAIFEQAAESIVLVDRDTGVLVEFNNAAHESLGYTREEFEKLKIPDFEVIESVEEVAKHIEKIVKEGSDVFETKHRTKSGEIRDIQVSSKVISIRGRAFIQSIWRDITERKRAVGRPLTPLQTRFVKSGLEGFDEREIMELLLSLCPGGMPEQVSEKCLKVFPNIRGLLSATPQELRKAGLSPLFITYLKLLHDIPAEVLREKIMENPAYGSSLQIFDYLYYSMRDLKKEVFKVIYLNNQDRIIDIVNLFEGTTGMIYVSPRKVIEEAIEHNTAALIFVHNHPSGEPTASKTDKRLTRDFVFVGNVLQIRVLDHIIIGENRYFSFADEGLIQQYEDEFLRMEIKRI